MNPLPPSCNQLLGELNVAEISKSKLPAAGSISPCLQQTTAENSLTLFQKNTTEQIPITFFAAHGKYKHTLLLEQPIVQLQSPACLLSPAYAGRSVQVASGTTKQTGWATFNSQPGRTPLATASALLHHALQFTVVLLLVSPNTETHSLQPLHLAAAASDYLKLQLFRF